MKLWNPTQTKMATLVLTERSKGLTDDEIASHLAQTGMPTAKALVNETIQLLDRQLAAHVLRRIGARVPQLELISEICNLTGMSRQLVEPFIEDLRNLVTKALSAGFSEGARQAINASVQQGVSDAIADYRRMHPPRRMLRRMASLLVGGFLCFASLGGFVAGEVGPAAVMLFVGMGLVSLFWWLRPKPAPNK